MRLTVVGCAGSFPNATSAASCYLVEHAGTAVVLDLGSGALGPLGSYVDVRRGLDAVLLSHLHADHCLDLAGLYVARRYHPDGPPSTPLAVHAPAGAARRIADAYRAGPADPITPMGRIFHFAELGHGPVQIGSLTITTAPAAHPVAAFSIRVEADGRALVYSGDTGPTPALVELSRGADLALFEASTLTRPDNTPNLHLSAAQAGEHARAAGVPRLLLTHLVAWNDPAASLAEASAAFGGELGLAAPGMRVEV